MENFQFLSRGGEQTDENGDILDCKCKHWNCFRHASDIEVEKYFFSFIIRHGLARNCFIDFYCSGFS